MGKLGLFVIVFAAISISNCFQSTNRVFKIGDTINGLTFIGSKGDQMSTQNSPRQSLYFSSDSLMSWTMARQACIDFLGYEASLISIESEEEAAFVDSFLRDSGNRLTSFWSSGQYYEKTQNYFWPNGEKVKESLWAEDEPSINGPDRRTVSKRNGTSSFKLFSENMEERHGFLCEFIYGSDVEPVPCMATNDIVMVVDSSASISSEEYRDAEEFVQEAATAWIKFNGGIEHNTSTRIGMVVFSENVHWVFSLDNALNVDQMGDKILGAPHLSMGTASHLALEAAFTHIKQDNRSTDEDSIRNNVVFLTDGYFHYPDLTKAAANLLHNGHVRTFAIGVENARESELKHIASDPNTNVFMVKDFSSLKHILKPLSLGMCG